MSYFQYPTVKRVMRKRTRTIGIIGGVEQEVRERHTVGGGPTVKRVMVRLTLCRPRAHGGTHY